MSPAASTVCVRTADTIGAANMDITCNTTHAVAKKVEGKSDAEVDAMIEEMGAAVEKRRRREKQSENPISSTKQPARPALPPRPKDE
jgi:hypothetical protein